MSSTLKFEKIIIPGANFGPLNPLPDIKNQPDPHSGVKTDDSISIEDAKYIGYGSIFTILPYQLQDSYDRDKQPKEYEAAILENEYIKAEFLPCFGGRLWSLYDKENQRHLLHRNPVIQPCNLALRNAWISGGVEWNIGMTGHTPFTVDPVHTATYTLSDGTPVLQMYEWERIRRVSFQIDAYLKSRYLFISVRLRNTHNEEVPMYWWSNMAVDETPDTRVIAPAAKAFKFDYTSVLSLRDVPVIDGTDVSYSTNSSDAMDLFYKIQPQQRKWEAALDGKGEGLIQCSTDMLKGRKLFIWGQGPGGKRWQEYLSAPGCAYIETQAGLGNTQMECVPMPAKACWQWVEAYGMMKADPDIVHSSNWEEAYTHVDSQLEKDLPRHILEDELNRLSQEPMPNAEIKSIGSGWARLELIRQGLGDYFEGETAAFPESSLTEAQAPWLELLQTGAFPDADINKPPAAYITQPEWLKLLESSVRAGKSTHWHAYNHLGVMYYAAGHTDMAMIAFETSCKLKNNAWAIRNIAALKSLEGEKLEAADMFLEAANMLPIPQLAIECGKALTDAERYKDYVNFYDNLPEDVQGNGRIQMLLANAAAKLGDYNRCKAILTSGLQVYDIREGEVLLSDIWVDMHRRKLIAEGNPDNDQLTARVHQEYPVPPEIDFRMRTTS